MSNTQPNEEVSERGDDNRFGIDSDTADAIETLATASQDAVSAVGSFDSGALFEILADPGHQYVLTYLLQSNGAVSCTELVDYVVDQTDHTMTPDQFRQRVVSELTKNHLPELDERGFVQYNMERQMVDSTDLTPLAQPYLLLALAHQEMAKKGADS